MNLKTIARRSIKKLTRRIGTAVGASAATYISVTPEQAAQLEAALILILGLAVDFGLERIAVLKLNAEEE